MDTEGVLAATGHELAQEDNLVADLLDAYIVVAYGGELLTTYFANVIIFIGLVVTDAETEMDSADS